MSKQNMNDKQKYDLHFVDDKIINDPIHGHISLEKDLIKIVDTCHFQRLRDLKQLGSCYYVFPGASHNRFEHCIGVSHLAGELLDRFRSKQKELEITDREAHLVRVAALCHDLGHGPFSHVFDNEFIPRVKPNTEWQHEKASLLMLEHMIETNNLDYSKDDVKFIGDLIMGDQNVTHSDIPATHEYMYGKDEKKFLWQIVANKTNSVDVDKFDYLARDSYNLGLKTSYDFTRIMKFSKVVGGEICYSAKEAYNLYEMFHTRYSLHKQIYTHRVGKAVEYMITDALVAADSFLKISDCIEHPEEYMTMTDCLLRQIEFSKAPELAESRAIIQRLRKRDLYKFVDEALLYSKFTKKVTAADILYHQDSNYNLSESDVIVHDLKTNYAMKDRNPVDYCKFYSSGSKDPFYLEKDSVSLLIPDKFQERFIRLYVRDKDNLEPARIAFANWVRSLQNTGATPQSVKIKTPGSGNIPRSPISPLGPKNLLADFSLDS